jgi:hypothetical protein
MDSGITPLPDAGTLTCEEELAMTFPDVPPACGTCLCDSCETEMQDCRDSAGCVDDIMCAQSMCADAADPTTCVVVNCSPSGTALSALLCLQNNCSTDCGL